MLPNLSGLRHAPASTGPYVDVLGDDQVCAISQQPFGSYTRSGKAFRRNACPKGWQLLVVDPSGGTHLEPNYYDTIELAMWLLDGSNTMSPTRTGWIDNADRLACIAKARQLLPVEKDWRDGLEAYKEFRYPTPPPEPESWVPSDDDESMDEAWVEELQWEILGEFQAFGDEMLTALTGAASNTLNSTLVSWLPELSRLNWRGARPLHYSRLVPIVTPVNFLEDAQPTDTVYVDLTLALRAYGVNTRTRLEALVSSAYTRYRVALSVQAWTHSQTGDGGWQRFWDANDNERLQAAHASARPHYPNTYDGLQEWALQLAEEQLKQLPPNMHWFELDKANVYNLLLAGWANIDAIVANVTLTLYVLLNLYWRAPYFDDFRDPRERLEELANLRNLGALQGDYLRRVMYDDARRILDRS
jgi:hypothetical protein